IAARMAIIAMTTSSSIRVKPGRRLRRMRAMTMFLLLKRSLARSPPAREFLLACLKLRLLWAARIGLGGTDVPAPDQRALAPPTGMAVAPRDECAAVMPVTRQMLGADPWRAGGDSVNVLVAFHVHAVPQRAAPTGLIRLDLDGGLPPLLHLRRLRDH